MSNTTTGLMRKTKKELIEIILRKDDVERALRTDMEKVTTKNETYEKQLDDMAYELTEVQNKLRIKTEDYISLLETCRNNNDDMDKQANLIRKYKTGFAVSSVLLVLAIILFIVC